MVSSFQMPLNRSVRTVVDDSRSAFNVSVWIDSIPVNLLYFIALSAILTSGSIGGPVSMSRKSVAGGMSENSSGFGLLRTLRRCLTYLAACLHSLDISLLPSLF